MTKHAAHVVCACLTGDGRPRFLDQHDKVAAAQVETGEQESEVRVRADDDELLSAPRLQGNSASRMHGGVICLLMLLLLITHNVIM